MGMKEECVIIGEDLEGEAMERDSREDLSIEELVITTEEQEVKECKVDTD